MKKIALVSCVLLLAACASQSELDTAQLQVEELQAEATVLQSEMSQTEDSLEASNAELAGAQQANQDLQIELEEMTASYDDARRQVTSLTSHVNRLVCDDQIVDMKYENILDASTIIAAWWARQSEVERVQGTYRDSIWSNADTKVHAVRYVSSDDNQQYVEHFLIYFREFGMTPGVFWVKGQCWLDEP